MLELYYWYDVEDSLYLAPLDWLFADRPPLMKAKEYGYVQVIREKGPDLCVVRVSPVALHLAGPFANMRIEVLYEDEVFRRILPVRQAPKKPHACRQQRMHPSGTDGEWQ